MTHEQEPITDYCPNCGAYHAIYGPCDSDQTEPDLLDVLDDWMHDRIDTF